MLSNGQIGAKDYMLQFRNQVIFHIFSNSSNGVPADSLQPIILTSRVRLGSVFCGCNILLTDTDDVRINSKMEERRALRFRSIKNSQSA